eukprot:15472821-Alexandrium_andersonii.AAC.1
MDNGVGAVVQRLMLAPLVRPAIAPIAITVVGNEPWQEATSKGKVKSRMHFGTCSEALQLSSTRRKHASATSRASSGATSFARSVPRGMAQELENEGREDGARDGDTRATAGPQEHGAVVAAKGARRPSWGV